MTKKFEEAKENSTPEERLNLVWRKTIMKCKKAKRIEQSDIEIEVSFDLDGEWD